MKSLTRFLRIEGDIAFVPLTRGLFAVIDAEDAHLVEGVHWHALRSRRTDYAVRNINLPSGKRSSTQMHRVIMGHPKGVQIDHIDGDGLNNRRSNLRVASPADNNRNRAIQANNTSGFKGVSFHKVTGKWTAQMTVDGKARYLGLFEDPEVAHAAYCEAASSVFGEFANTGA